MGKLGKCSACGKEVNDSQLYICFECGKQYCVDCAEKHPVIKTLGVCPDCEEAFEAEADYWGW